MPILDPSLGKPVTTQTLSLLELVSRAWGPAFREPDKRVYEFSNGRSFESTDLGQTGIYRKR